MSVCFPCWITATLCSSVFLTVCWTNFNRLRLMPFVLSSENKTVDHATPLHHCQSVAPPMDYKIDTLGYPRLHDLALYYLSELLTPLPPESGIDLLVLPSSVPSIRQKKFCRHSVSF